MDQPKTISSGIKGQLENLEVRPRLFFFFSRDLPCEIRPL